MKLSDTVIIKETKEVSRIEQVIKTYKFNPDTISMSYILSDGKEYQESELKYDRKLSRDNKLKDLIDVRRTK